MKLLRWSRIAVAAVTRAVPRIFRSRLLDAAAAVSFYALLAMLPTLLLLVAFFSRLHLQRFAVELAAAFGATLPGSTAVVVGSEMNLLFSRHLPSLLGFGAVSLIYSSSQGITGLMAALNAAYQVQETRPWWKRQLMAFELTALFALFFLSLLALLLLSHRIFQHVPVVLVWLQTPVRLLLTLLMMGVALIVVYRAAPNNPRLRERGVVPAVGVALLCWAVASLGFGFYVQHIANYNALYGSLGEVIALLLWLYLLSLSVLAGAEIHREILHSREAPH